MDRSAGWVSKLDEISREELEQNIVFAVISRAILNDRLWMGNGRE